MEFVLFGQDNYVSLPVVAKASGSPITSGTVTFYLVRRDIDAQVTASGTHIGDGHWGAVFLSTAWVKDVQYLLYAKESGNLHIPVSCNILCVESFHDSLDSYSNKQSYGGFVGETLVNYYVYENEQDQLDPISDCKVWVTTDSSGEDVVASGTTNDVGKVTFYLNSGVTYYFWRKKAGFDFTNPDTETIGDS